MQYRRKPKWAPFPSPERQKLSLHFLTIFLAVTFNKYLYGPFYITLSGVTRPLHPQLKPFAIYQWDPFTPWWGRERHDSV